MPPFPARAEIIQAPISTQSIFPLCLNYSASVEIIFHMISFSDGRVSELSLDFIAVADTVPLGRSVTELSMFILLEVRVY